MEDIVVGVEELAPAGLSSRENLRRAKIPEVIMVAIDINWVLGALDVGVPVLEGLDYR